MTDYVMVPREPTLEMVIAGENYIGRHAWAKMIAAAPQQQVEPPQDRRCPHGVRHPHPCRECEDGPQQQAEQVRLIETQPGSPNFDGADAWNAQPTESRITAEQVEGLKRLADEYAKASSTPEYNDEAEPNARAALHAALDALVKETP